MPKEKKNETKEIERWHHDLNQEKRYDELYNPPFFELKILYACICSSISIHLFFNSNLKKKGG